MVQKGEKLSYASTASSSSSTASSSSAARPPPVPPKPFPPKKPNKPTPSVFDPVAPTAFFSTSSSPTVPSKNPSTLAQRKVSGSRKAAVVPREYIEIDTDDDRPAVTSTAKRRSGGAARMDDDEEEADDELSISTAKSAVPPAVRRAAAKSAYAPTTTAKFRPGKDKDSWQVDETLASYEAPVAKRGERTAAAWKAETSAWDSESELEMTPTTRASTPVRGRIGWRSKGGPEGPGMVVDKVVAFEREDGGKAGVWEDLTWEPLLAIPDDGDDKHKPLGVWVPWKKETSATPEVEVKSEGDQVMASATEDAAALPASEASAMDEDVNPPLPSTSEPSKSSPVLPPPLPRGFSIPTREEVDNARPHPHAYFSPRTMSWSLFVPLPFLDDSSFPRGEDRVDNWRYTPDLTVDLDALTPPLPLPFSPAKLNEFSPDAAYDEWQPSPLRRMVNTMGSAVAHSTLGFYPGVIPRALWDAFCDKDPQPGKTRTQSLIAAAIIIWRALDNLMFRGEARSVPTNGKTFVQSLNFDTLARDIFVAVLGFSLNDNSVLTPPEVDERKPEGLVNRARLLRCWLELGMWIAFNRLKCKEAASVPVLRLAVHSSRDSILKTLGGGSLPRIENKFAWTNVNGNDLDPAANEYHILGVTPVLADDVIISMYHDQSEYVPAERPTYLGCVQAIGKLRGTDKLSMFLGMERSQGHYTNEDLAEAYKAIGVEAVDAANLSEDILMSAFTTCLSDPLNATGKVALREACKLIAKSRESDLLTGIIASLEDVAKPKMDLAKAYRQLEMEGMGGSADPSLIITIYGVRIMDHPKQTDTMREALEVIGEELKSEEIKRFLATGEIGSGWEAGPVTSLDRPVGLTNIANTCYLNSLLQYFFTIRELRETILNYSADFATLANDDELPRVGGRLVTKAEVERSRRFAILLQGLFSQLIHSHTSAVTPETELAYLALVPSKEEPAPKVESAAIIVDAHPPAMDVSSAESPALSSSERDKSPASVLGKRTSEHLDGDSTLAEIDLDPMVIDSQQSTRSPLGERDPNKADVTSPSVNKPSIGRPRAGTGTLPFDADLATSLSTKEAPDGVMEIGLPDVEMTAAPPLPPRVPKGKEKDTSELEKEVSTYMSFGKQNDVTECMDNVMFQLECALNPTSTDTDGGDAASLVKRTFYGKMKQQLEITDPAPDEKEPLRISEEPFFSLLVDVAEDGHNVYDGLDKVFDDAVVDIEGKQARRRITLVDVPPILQIQLQRVQYDRVKKNIFKSNAHLSFSPTIAMDRYLEIDPKDEDAVARRDRTMACRHELEVARTRLQDLTKIKDTDMSQVLRNMHHYLKGQLELIDEDLPALLEDTLLEAKCLESELSALRRQIEALRGEIEAIWLDQKSATFELVSVFIHRGSASSGHYYIYQRDSKKPQRWLKYNDSVVSDIDPQEDVFRETTGDSNAYFLVYCRSDRLDTVDTIKREG